MEKDRKPMDDAVFADGALRTLPTVPVPPALEARILADFDRVAARNAPGPITRMVRRWQETVWPGAPAWKPASVLALSLAIGLMAGVLVPTTQLGASGATASASEQLYAAADPLPVVSMAEGL